MPSEDSVSEVSEPEDSVSESDGARRLSSASESEVSEPDSDLPSESEVSESDSDDERRLSDFGDSVPAVNPDGLN